ncbi:MAG TPA: GlsB/YeaQ/YmgE family stress response membrane protein [Terriglobales bacterium]|nr:GlsB/YeaQ/YmgE family stress response membrane protein [Terriglobales bacterium]
MDAQALIIWLIVGAIAGWLAGMVVKGTGYGLIGDIVVGIVGGLIAGWLLPQLGIAIGGGFIAAIINAFIGAVILLIALRLIKRVA